ncbi:MULTISPECIES: flagellar export chaperone FliS [unclassified Halanaerobium]|uniref:flagellar export chaperone FliS n=1 Tax=unclassified Halanaerobium TaxID=2641197 RepID=UPI000DF2E9CA|nr:MULTISPECIES: flagellar export chaperone FliS [unclassified Halanaerobium]RCW47708.1 flagellar protein FliS [Halanaerobium sp. MA284_MarDTE_T2]RCW84648.1 flagellar protein FliS [Halanaerobium sp. DL-01]
MRGRNAEQQYKQMQIKTAGPGKLLLMLYQGSIKFMKVAVKEIEMNNIEAAHENIIKAQNIILELKGTLNKEQGGEIAKNLERLYNFIYQELLRANLRKEKEHIENVIPLVEELFESYQEIVSRKNPKKLKVNVGG